MSNNSFDSSVTLRNIDIQNTLAQIAAENLLQFYSSDQLMADYNHLFNEYFENVYMSDIDDYFVSMIKSANPSDVDVFLIKCSIYIKGSKGHKPLLLSALYNSISSYIGNNLNENGMYFRESEFLKAISDFLFDFLDIIDLSDYFTELKNRYKQGLLSHQPDIVTTSIKLKTNLSVPQLVLLFRSLNEIKPPIFDVKYKKELVDFIVANFETKGTSSLKSDSIGNKFSEFDQNARDFWLKHISTIQKYILDLEEK
jgi:hypothetical protein